MSAHVAKRRKGEDGNTAPKSKAGGKEKTKKVLKVAKAPEPAAHASAALCIIASPSY